MKSRDAQVSESPIALFSDRERSAQEPKSGTESEYGYLDRSGRPEAGQVRAFLTRWLDQYPAEHRIELAGRLKSGNDREFRSGNFELVLFACARSMGYDVEVHPALTNGSTKRPDFLLTRGDEPGFYLEAVVASELSGDKQAAQKLVNSVLQAIDTLPSANFFLGIIVSGTPTKAPSTKALRRNLAAWLASLDPDAASRAADVSAEDLPRWSWSADGLTIHFRAIPKKPEARHPGQGTIGMHSGAFWGNNRTPMRDAVRDKGTKFGKLDRPLLVAVNVDSMALDAIDEMEALFGQEEYVETIGMPDSGRMRRIPNGIWQGPQGPVLTRLSGVWIFHELNAWNLASRTSTLYLHPVARHRLPEHLMQLSHAEVDAATGKVRRVQGVSISDLLGLAVGWPGQ